MKLEFGNTPMDKAVKDGLLDLGSVGRKLLTLFAIPGGEAHLRFTMTSTEFSITIAGQTVVEMKVEA